MIVNCHMHIYSLTFLFSNYLTIYKIIFYNLIILPIFIIDDVTLVKNFFTPKVT